MRNECNIVRDILPLYTEHMVSTDSSEFVEEHLAGCEACRRELAAMTDAEKNTPNNGEVLNSSAMPMRIFRKRWNQRNRRIIGTTALITALIVLLGTYLIGSGLTTRNDVILLDYSLSQNGTSITLYTGVASSMGYVRGFSNNGGGVKPHYLVFYNTFGGLNSSIGARSNFTLALEETDQEIFFYHGDGGYELVLQKDEETGQWERP